MEITGTKLNWIISELRDLVGIVASVGDKVNEVVYVIPANFSG